MQKKNFSLLVCALALLAPSAWADNITVIYNSSNNNRIPYYYNYAYKNPPRQSLDAWGRYIFSSSRVRYVHSPSKLKGARHAARIDYNNRIYDL